MCEISWLFKLRVPSYPMKKCLDFGLIKERATCEDDHEFELNFCAETFQTNEYMKTKNSIAHIFLKFAYSFKIINWTRKYFFKQEC
jgi:hypothetical protein